MEDFNSEETTIPPYPTPLAGSATPVVWWLKGLSEMSRTNSLWEGRQLGSFDLQSNWYLLLEILTHQDSCRSFSCITGALGWQRADEVQQELSPMKENVHSLENSVKSESGCMYGRFFSLILFQNTLGLQLHQYSKAWTVQSISWQECQEMKQEAQHSLHPSWAQAWSMGQCPFQMKLTGGNPEHVFDVFWRLLETSK